MAETTGENFGLKDMPPVQPEAALELGGSRVVNGEKLKTAFLNGQNEMVAPITDLLSSLVQSGQLKEEALTEALQGAIKPAGFGSDNPESQVVRNVSERFVELMAVRLAGGNAEKAKNMLGNPVGNRSSFDSDMGRLANFVTKEARQPVKK
jgi:hypothetical protein